jgi:hypothetical protein
MQHSRQQRRNAGLRRLSVVHRDEARGRRRVRARVSRRGGTRRRGRWHPVGRVPARARRQRDTSCAISGSSATFRSTIRRLHKRSRHPMSTPPEALLAPLVSLMQTVVDRDYDELARLSRGRLDANDIRRMVEDVYRGRLAMPPLKHYADEVLMDEDDSDQKGFPRPVGRRGHRRSASDRLPAASAGRDVVPGCPA